MAPIFASLPLVRTQKLTYIARATILFNCRLYVTIRYGLPIAISVMQALFTTSVCFGDQKYTISSVMKKSSLCHLVGDLAYSLHPNMIVPYSDNGHLTERQNNFNFCLTSARIAIETAFDLLKGKFRCLLDRLPINNTKNVAHCILAVMLHFNMKLRGYKIDVICLIKTTEQLPMPNVN